MIIGLIGQKGVGKTTIMNEFKDFNHINFKDVLVDEIKENFSELLVAIKDVYKSDSIDALFEEKQPLVRALLQNYGVEVRRRDDKDYWIKRFLRKLVILRGDTIVGDIRFLNEAETIRDVGGILVKIVRDTNIIDSHKSETEQNKIVPDHIIENTTTINNAAMQLRNIINIYKQ